MIPCVLFLIWGKKTSIDVLCHHWWVDRDVLACIELTALEFSGHRVFFLVFFAEHGGGNHADNHKTGTDQSWIVVRQAVCDGKSATVASHGVT